MKQDAIYGINTDLKKTKMIIIIKLADKEFNNSLKNQSPIELVVEVDSVYKILHPGFEKVGRLVRLASILGYVLTGSYKVPSPDELGFDFKNNHQLLLAAIYNTLLWFSLKETLMAWNLYGP